MAQDKKTISLKEVGYWSKQLNCKADAVRLAKIIVGGNTEKIKQTVEEMRKNSDGITHLLVSIPVDKLFGKEGE